METKSFRDLTLIQISQEQKLVIACDSSGGIGSKVQDVVQVPPYIVGRYISRVPLMEVLAAGAKPVSVINTLAVEMEPTGKEIIKGITDEIKLLNLAPEQLLNGSTEDNIPTIQTGLGITVIGTMANQQSRLGTSSIGDRVFLVGLPKMGTEIFLDDPETVDLQTVLTLLVLEEIKEVLPVGSKGIEYETQQIVSGINATIKWVPKVEVDLIKSAGPATCLILTAAGDSNLTAHELGKMVKKPVQLLGQCI